MDFRTTKKITHTPLTIKDEAVERVRSYKFLGVTITEDFSWSDNIACIVSKAQQQLYFLRKLRKANLPQKLIVNFYRCTIESILTNCMTAWYGSCTKSLKTLVTLTTVCSSFFHLEGDSNPSGYAQIDSKTVFFQQQSFWWTLVTLCLIM